MSSPEPFFSPFRRASRKQIAFYDAAHELNSAARKDRVQWLTSRLGLKRVNLSALDAIPPLE